MNILFSLLAGLLCSGFVSTQQKEMKKNNETDIHLTEFSNSTEKDSTCFNYKTNDTAYEIEKLTTALEEQ
jgi:hypothetical protein